MSELLERRALNPLSLASLRALAFNTCPPPSSSKRYGFVTRKGLPDSMLALLLHGRLVVANAVESGRWRHLLDDYDAMGALVGACTRLGSSGSLRPAPQQPADVRHAGLHSLLHVRSHSCPPACAVCTVASGTGTVAQIFTRGVRQPAALSLFHTGISILILSLPVFCNFMFQRFPVSLEALPRLVRAPHRGPHGGGHG